MDPAQIEAATVLDLASRTFTYFGPGEIGRLVQHLAGYQVLVGLHVRDLAIALGLDPEARTLVDLKPPQRSVVVNKQGKKLKITPELLVSGTTGIGSPLADPAKVAEYLATGDDRKLARRLESDAKALFAFYRYGVLHGFVRLRWGFLDELYAVEWALPGDAQLRELEDAARANGTPVDLVTGNAPGWGDPWSRAVRVHVPDPPAPWPYLVTEGAGGPSYLDRRDIQAVRPAASDRA